MKRFFLMLFLLPSIVVAQNNPKTAEDYYEGLLPGLFSVSPTQKVRFSKGNLQFKSSSREWKFADNQYEIIGEDPDKFAGKPLTNLDGWIDVLCWGQNGCDGHYPGAEGFIALPADGHSPFDWGYEPIINGGKFCNMWRNLTYKEWRYLIAERNNAKEKFSSATVCGIKGFVLLPDIWVLPSGCSFKKENARFDDTGLDCWEFESSNYSNNIYNQSQWSAMEKNGAIFLPSAADLSGFNLGWYWSSTALNDCAYEIVFDSGHLYVLYEPKYKSNGMSVRLVKNDIEVLYNSPDNHLTKLTKVTEKDGKIVADFTVFATGWVSIDPKAYLKTCTGEIAKLIGAKGIEMAPKKTEFDESSRFKDHHFSLIFESLSKSINEYDSFSIIESEESSWKWSDIIIIK